MKLSPVNFNNSSLLSAKKSQQPSFAGGVMSEAAISSAKYCGNVAKKVGISSAKYFGNVLYAGVDTVGSVVASVLVTPCLLLAKGTLHEKKDVFAYASERISERLLSRHDNIPKTIKCLNFLGGVIRRIITVGLIK